MWGDGYVGLGDNGVPDVLISDDGRTWQGADLGESFPPGMIWYPTGFAAGDGGIGVMSETWVADTTPRGVPDPPSIERDGHTLSLDHRTGRLTLDSAQGAQSWSVWTEQSQDGIELDLEKRVVAFLDSNTGEPTVSFSFDELNEMESALYPSSSGGVYHRGFSFSADGANWTMQNMATEIGEDGRVLELEVTDDHVVALVSRDPDWTRPYGVESFEIWSAVIPDEASSGNGTSP
jgi:hypothetical protein